MKLPSSLADRLLQRRFRRSLQRMALDRYRISVAHTSDEHEDAFRLVRVAYTYEGILPIRTPELRISSQHVLPEATVLVAHEGDTLVGTLTVTLDSPAGLPLDASHRRELDGLRAEGARMVEFGSLAVFHRCRRNGLSTLINMAAYWFAMHVLEATHGVIGINPRAAPWHRAIYNFSPLGPPCAHADLLEAPVQGMAQTIGSVSPHFERRFPRPLVTGGMLHEHFFGTLPPCIEMPPLRNLEDLARWKLPRAVFQRLFIDKSTRLHSLDPKIREHLEGWRTLRTLGQPASSNLSPFRPPRSVS